MWISPFLSLMRGPNYSIFDVALFWCHPLSDNQMLSSFFLADGQSDVGFDARHCNHQHKSFCDYVLAMSDVTIISVWLRTARFATLQLPTYIYKSENTVGLFPNNKRAVKRSWFTVNCILIHSFIEGKGGAKTQMCKYVLLLTSGRVLCWSVCGRMCLVPCDSDSVPYTSRLSGRSTSSPVNVIHLHCMEQYLHEGRYWFTSWQQNV